MAKRDINSVRILWNYGVERGLSSEQILANSNLDDGMLSEGSIQIDDAQELKVFENLLTELGDPFRLGVELGSRYQLTSYGIVGYALLSSATMRKAVTLAMRYLGLTYVFSDIQLHERGHSFELAFTTEIPGELGTLVLIRDIWAASVIQQELFSEDRLPVSLQLQCPAPDYCDLVGRDKLERALGANIQFGARRNAYIGPSDILDKPLAKANDITARICEEQCRELLLKKQSWKEVSEQVRDLLLSEGLDTSMDVIASKLARTSRTLHRQLQEEGTTWRKVRDDVRMGLAEALLKQPLQLDEIAERLGYSDAANFSHGFKRCKGMSPSEFRRAYL